MFKSPKRDMQVGFVGYVPKSDSPEVIGKWRSRFYSLVDLVAQLAHFSFFIPKYVAPHVL